MVTHMVHTHETGSSSLSSARLFKHIEFKPNGCWEWTGAKNKPGYGRMKVNGKFLSPHRVAYVLFRGSIPENNDVCHKCDNPPCFNPDHLFAGTRSDNMMDCSNKGRRKPIPIEKMARGSGVGTSVLIEREVSVIKFLLKQGWRLQKIANMFHVHIMQISRIKRGIAWKHVN